MINGKNILITGGTGSFGKKFVQLIVDRYKPEKLIIFSRDELKQFEMQQKWSTKEYPFIRYFLGDVRDKDRLMRAFSGVDFVIHAAALKQVPAAEYNPQECIKTNVMGAMNTSIMCLWNPRLWGRGGPGTGSWRRSALKGSPVEWGTLVTL